MQRTSFNQDRGAVKGPFWQFRDKQQWDKGTLHLGTHSYPERQHCPGNMGDLRSVKGSLEKATAAGMIGVSEDSVHCVIPEHSHTQQAL